MIENFTPLSATIGGAMVGAAASIILLTTGRVAGISGVYGGLLKPVAGDVGWRVAFVLGLLLGGVALTLLLPSAFAVAEGRSLGLVALGGLFVGFGTRMGNGCTSGHGICGLTRLSVRSAVAVGTFMATGFASAMLISWFGGAR
jgi:uncharacterized membrane protein YedE/YeeE